MTGGNPLGRYFDERYPDALKYLDGLTIPAGQWAQDAAGTPTIIKASAVIQVPYELLMDAGVIPDTRPPLPPPSWRTRLRRKRDQWREAAARRAFRLIAGYEVPDGNE